jgi:hypothetical protein
MVLARRRDSPSRGTCSHTKPWVLGAGPTCCGSIQNSNFWIKVSCGSRTVDRFGNKRAQFWIMSMDANWRAFVFVRQGRSAVDCSRVHLYRSASFRMKVRGSCCHLNDRIDPPQPKPLICTPRHPDRTLTLCTDPIKSIT